MRQKIAASLHRARTGKWKIVDAINSEPRGNDDGGKKN